LSPYNLNKNDVLNVAVYAEGVLDKANFQPGVFTNLTHDAEKASFDSLHILAADGTRFIVATHVTHV
jgi:hypothetical protein